MSRVESYFKYVCVTPRFHLQRAQFSDAQRRQSTLLMMRVYITLDQLRPASVPQCQLIKLFEPCEECNIEGAQRSFLTCHSGQTANCGL